MTAKLKLLWLTQHYPPAAGGMALSCDRLVRHLRAQGVSITLYHLKHDSPAKTSYYSEEFGCDNRVALGDNAAHGLNLLWHDIAEQPFDAIIAYGFPWAMHGARIFAAWKQLPLFTLIRGNDFDINILDPRRSAMLLEVLGASSKVLTVSQDKATRINALFPAVEQPPLAINMSNALDFSLWQALPFDIEQASTLRQRMSLAPQTKVIGLVGHLKAKKGIAFFIDTLKQHGLLGEQLHLLLVGDIDSVTADLLADLPEHSYSQQTLLDRYELPARYLACDLIAIPSFYDGTPNVLMEAAALGIPLLGANCGGMADLLDDSNSWHFTPANRDELINAIRDWLASSPAQIMAKAQQLQQRIITDCDAEQEATRYIEVITNTISQLPGR